MFIPRIIPCLLINNGALVKGREFNNFRYLGDPLNAIRIFNDKEVHELMLIDISATPNRRAIDPLYIERIAKECSMPLAVGGGVKDLQSAKELISAGAEKIIIGTAATKNPEIVEQISSEIGNQSLVVSIEVKKVNNSNTVWMGCGKENANLSPIIYAQKCVTLGAGELLINSINHDGLMCGYEIDLIKSITSLVDIPVIALGGAGDLRHLRHAVSDARASAVAAGSLFVFHGRRRAVLINYPDPDRIQEAFD